MDPNHITPRAKVVVSRRWHSPEIMAFVTKENVGAGMELSDFIRALVSDMFGDKNRMIMLSKGDVTASLLEASDSILQAMKDATVHVV